MGYFKSPLRYPGGKSRALKFLKTYFLKDFKEYREPFFGGGSVGLYLAQTHLEEAQFYANDLNYDVYCFWQTLKTQGHDLIGAIQQIKQDYTNGRELYQILLERRREGLSDFQRAVDFFVLNRICFSGVVDCGGYSQKAYETRFTQTSIQRLYHVQEAIKKFAFTSNDYAELLQKDGHHVFIFLDPPYYNAAKSRLYGKKGDLHLGFDHQNLCDHLKQTKHKFLLTYDDSCFIRGLYKNFYIREYRVQYGMNNYKQEKALAGKELLISNFVV
ncbi:DNA adenine methylase [Helicobacter baculiformis]|uniref:site-specific DNA-methyltransferase (adenine-specific) n=1 Tax=Helicobacter baculiformis TaxID=427351 RepID=A0ABV7ZIB2_9HELI|nr:DNA adenine methylase [Helicobacter baculiformis]